MNYWQERAVMTQERLTTKNIKETEKQLIKYYRRTAAMIEKEFVATYNKLWNTVIRDNNTATPADLYRLESYWQLQGQLRQELQRLGDRQAALMEKNFVTQWIEIYEQLQLGDNSNFSMADPETALQMINQIWCADGSSWEERIWTNCDKLQQALNDGLIECVLGGRDEKYLKQKLMTEFDVSFGRADALVRTEMAHIQTQAARQRYIDSGLQEMEIWASPDERRCDICGKKHKDIVKLYETDKMPPFHPRCRCCVLPVVEW